MPEDIGPTNVMTNLIGSFRKFWQPGENQAARSFGLRGQPRKKGPCLACFHVGQKNKRICTVSPTHIELYDTKNSKLIRSVETPGAHFTCAASGSVIQAHNGRRRRYPVVFLGKQAGIVQLFYPETGEFGLELDASGAAEDEELGEEVVEEGYDFRNDLTSLSIGVDEDGGAVRVFGGATGKVFCWDVHSGRLLDVLLAPDASAVVSSLAAVGDRILWIGLDSGHVLVVDVIVGELIGQPETQPNASVSAFTVCLEHGVIFVLSAHKKVFVFDLVTLEALNSFPAGLMTCGEDVSSFEVVAVSSSSASSKPTSILVLGATNGAYCMRRVGRRKDGRVHCVLLSTCSGSSDAQGLVGTPTPGFPPLVESCPITVLSYNNSIDTFLFGDAGGVVSEVCGLGKDLTDRQLLPASVRSPAGAPCRAPGSLIPYAPQDGSEPPEIPEIPSAMASGSVSPTLPGSELTDSSMPEIERAQQEPRSVSPKRLVLSPPQRPISSVELPCASPDSVVLGQMVHDATRVLAEQVGNEIVERATASLIEKGNKNDFDTMSEDFEITVISPPNSPPQQIKADRARWRAARARHKQEEGRIDDSDLGSVCGGQVEVKMSKVLKQVSSASEFHVMLMVHGLAGSCVPDEFHVVSSCSCRRWIKFGYVVGRKVPTKKETADRMHRGTSGVDEEESMPFDRDSAEREIDVTES